MTSIEETVDAFIDGKISRRTLIRRLAIGGVSLGAAVSYAHLLRPQRAPAQSMGDCNHVPGALFEVMIVKVDLDKVIDTKSLKVRVTTDQAVSVSLIARLIRPDNPTYPDARVGVAGFLAPGAGTFAVRIPLKYNPPYSIKAVRKERRRHGSAQFRVEAQGGTSCSASDTEVLVSSSAAG